MFEGTKGYSVTMSRGIGPLLMLVMLAMRDGALGKPQPGAVAESERRGGRGGCGPCADEKYGGRFGPTQRTFAS